MREAPRSRQRRRPRLRLGAPLLAVALALAAAGCPRDRPVQAPPDDPPSDQEPPRPFWRGHRVAFTFSSDDNDRDNLVWAEVFRERRARFTIFTTADWVGRSGKLAAGELGLLHDEGFEIGGHGMIHVPLAGADEATLDRELAGCARRLEELVDRPGYACRTFAYPYHSHDEAAMAAASRVYIAARNGGLHRDGRPNFSEGIARLDSVSLYEVPLPVTMKSIADENRATEEQTRHALRDRLPAWKDQLAWVNLYCHRLADCDAEHMGWILDELLTDGDVWIAPFGTVVDEYLSKRGRRGERPGGR